MPIPYPQDVQRLLTVSDLTASIRGLLEATFPFVAVVGEISNLRRPFSGHCYFTLKDSGAQIRAVLFKPQHRYLNFSPEDGMKVICRGRVTVYEPRGDYQFIVDGIEIFGAGSLQLAFDQLKKKLADEGMFSPAHKKNIPLFPETIALITSPTGAAVKDFLATVARRFPSQHIIILPVRVQGDAAAHEISTAIRSANTDIMADVIVLCRGGGSIEDLWPFNEEEVARAIFASVIPVVTGIGHEIDTTIADLVADQRTVTPTAAAEAVTPDRLELAQLVDSLNKRIQRKVVAAISFHQHKVRELRRFMLSAPARPQYLSLHVDRLVASLTSALQLNVFHRKFRLEKVLARLTQYDPQSAVQHDMFRLRVQHRHLVHLVAQALERKKRELATGRSLLQSLNPHAVLTRGYAIVRDSATKNVLRDTEVLTPNQRLEIRLAKGEITVRVEEKKIS